MFILDQFLDEYMRFFSTKTYWIDAGFPMQVFFAGEPGQWGSPRDWHPFGWIVVGLGLLDFHPQVAGGVVPDDCGAVVISCCDSGSVARAGSQP